MKHRVIQYSKLTYEELAFKPFKQRSRGVNYYDGFWLDLLKEYVRLAVSSCVSLLKTLSRLQGKKLLSRGLFALRHKEKFITLVLLLALIPAPKPAHAYLDPIVSKTPQIALKQPIEAPKIAEQAPLKEVPVPSSSSGAITIAGVTNCGDNIHKQFIYQHESGCRTNAINPIGACGLGQALPCSKMNCSLADFACQDAFFTSYAVGRYGSWEAAHAFWLGHSWW